jgi:phage tail sheath protein FI
MSTTTSLPNPLSTPGVYIQEIPVLPASIVSVPTAVPIFVGYTATAQEVNPKDLLLTPFKIDNILEYQQYFGGAYPETGISVNIDTSGATPVSTPSVIAANASKYQLFYALQMYFANGGGSCYIFSVGLYNTADAVINLSDYMVSGVFRPEIEQYVDITLVVCPDALGMSSGTDYYALQSAVIAHCAKLQNRMAVMDVYRNVNYTWQQDIAALRNGDTHPTNKVTGLNVQLPENWKYAAVYFPRILTDISYSFQNSAVKVNIVNGATVLSTTDLNTLKGVNGQQYFSALNAINNNLEMLLPAAPAMVGVYAAVDSASGVWTAPANVGIVNALDLEVQVSSFDQGEYLNIDPFTGLSVNAIRSFPGRGSAIVWGARTLAGNDNEWRYIPVRRFFFMVEQSVKNAIEPFVFAANDSNTWTRVKAMISNYLTEQWKQGALAGTTAKDAFYVNVGLGVTMSDLDIWEGRMIVQIGMAVVRPAEFIILQFLQMMQTS